jgi:hypothetical protein
MSTVRARMNRDAVGASVKSDTSEFFHVRNAEGAGVAQQRDLVNVNAEFCHIDILRDAGAGRPSESF